MIDGFAHEPPGRRRLLQLLTWTWCLPTTLVGLVAGLFTVGVLGGRATPFRGATVVRSPRLRTLGAVCLGPVILAPDTATPELVAHEWGHFRQHLRLGPAYLLVVGVPSLTHAVWHRLGGGGFPDYFHFWTEAWADHLGGVYARHAHLHPRWTGYALGPVLTLVCGALTLRAFGHVLAFPFTDADALVDVAWARFPLRDQLLVPLTGGLGGDNANFWRPAAMVQFWALRHLFGEVPAGWHAWSLLLHVVASVLAGLVVEALGAASRGGAPTARDRAVALLAAALFAAHPLAEEIVPATARNLDLLLAVGSFGALLALLRALTTHGPAQRLWRLVFFASAALALGAKEAGILLLPTCVAWIVLLDGRPLREGWPLRLRAMLRHLGPFAAFSLVFLAVRARVLHGVGGYHDADALADTNLLGFALQRAFVEPLFSSLSGRLAPLAGAPGVVFAFALWGVLLATLRRDARLLGLLAAVYLPWILLLGVTGTYSRRVLYVPSIAMAAVVALAGVSAVFSWGGAPPRNARMHAGSGPGAVAGRVALSIVTGLLFGAWLHGTPALRRYTDWDAVGRADATFLRPEVWAPIPANTTVWLVDRPARVDLDPRRYRLWSKRKSLNNAATSYAIEAWVDEHVPRGLSVRSLTSILPEGPPEAFPAVVASAAGVVRVARPPVARTVNAGKDVLVAEEPGGITLSVAPGAAPQWAVIWDPRGAAAVAVGAPLGEGRP